MYGAQYSEIQRNTAKVHTARHTAKLRIQPPVGLMSQAVPLAELERRLHIRLTSPIPAAHQQRNYEPNLVRGHEAAIRLVGPIFHNVLRHTRQIMSFIMKEVLIVFCS